MNKYVALSVTQMSPGEVSCLHRDVPASAQLELLSPTCIYRLPLGHQAGG